MAPRLQCLSLFCCAEAWWDPARPTDDVLRDFGRMVFGEELTEIGPLLEEFEVVPDWGYYPPFPYSPARLDASMTRLLRLLDRFDPTVGTRLPLAPTPVEYRRDLQFFAELFRKLAGVATTVEEVTAAARPLGVAPANREGLVSLDDLDDAPTHSAMENLRTGTAVFRFDRDHWETDGRVILNLSPDEAIRFNQNDLEMVGQEMADRTA